MDIPRPDQARKKRRRRIALGLGGLALISLITLGLARLKPAAPPVEKASLLFDTVKRGELVRQVRGNGTLVPQEIRWIPTIGPGRVERILVLPGAHRSPRSRSCRSISMHWSLTYNETATPFAWTKKRVSSGGSNIAVSPSCDSGY